MEELAVHVYVSGEYKDEYCSYAVIIPSEKEAASENSGKMRDTSNYGVVSGVVRAVTLALAAIVRYYRLSCEKVIVHYLPQDAHIQMWADNELPDSGKDAELAKQYREAIDLYRVPYEVEFVMESPKNRWMKQAIRRAKAELKES